MAAQYKMQSVQNLEMNSKMKRKIFDVGVWGSKKKKINKSILGYYQ